MMRRGEGTVLQKDPLSPSKLQEPFAPPAPKAFPWGLQTGSGWARYGPTKAFPMDGG